MYVRTGMSVSFWQVFKVTLVGLALGTASGSVGAQSGAQWYALDSSPPGTPPTIVLEPSSNLQQTDLDVTIHGFFYKDIEEMSQVFRRITLDKKPEWPLYRVVGRPELPALHHTLGNLVDASVDTVVVQVIDEVTLPNTVVYPAQSEHFLPDPPPSFQWDQTFYQQTTVPYPETRGAGVDSLGRFGGLALLGAETYPFRAIPASQTLVIARHFQVSIAHPGTGTPVSLEITRRQSRQYDLLLDNAEVVSPYRPPNIIGYAGDYLIIANDARNASDVEPLAEQKRRRGYAVTVATADETGSTWEEIRDYIANWWAGTGPGRDHYVLLVGRASESAVPTCTTEDGRDSDRLYACIDGLDSDGRPDPYAEVRVGRLPFRYRSECVEMVTKTLSYEDGYPGWFVGHVLLTAHMEEDPFWDFQEQQEDIRTLWPYEVPPVFTTLYGREGATNEEVIAEIDAGKGVVCYYGHGTVVDWYEWNGGHFERSDVELLSNGERTPVVFSLACSNNGMPIDHSLCIGETWMVTTERAVAHYGATDVTSTACLVPIDIGLFQMIYNEHQVTLGEAVMGAENEVIEFCAERGLERSCIWVQSLYGDPELKVWREPPEVPPIGGYPASVPPGPGAIEVHVGGLPASGAEGAEASSEPVEFAIVSLYKPGEFQENRYTDAQGIANVPIDPTSPGWIYLTVYTEFDSRAVAQDSILVESTGDVPGDDPGSRVLRLAPPSPNPSSGETVISYTLPQEGPVRLSILDAEGRLVAMLLDQVQGSGPHVLSWTGRDGRGAQVASGVYLVRLEAEGEVRSRKIVVAR